MPEPLSCSETTDFGKLADNAVSRRRFLDRSVLFGAAAFVMGTTLLPPRPAPAVERRLDFAPVAANSLDTITVPRGYSWQVVVRWGDPLWSNGVAFDQSTRGSGASQELAFGDNNDGMALFSDGSRSVLAVNNEYVGLKVIYPGSGAGTPRNADDVRKAKAGHGMSIVEITQKDGVWSIVQDSPYNRRITADTPMAITGPARGHDWMKTAGDPAGMQAKGTWSNCGSGRTPWGTYLSCEENFDAYFSSSDPGLRVNDALKRYGVRLEDYGYGWAGTDERFDIAEHPNEPNRAGYVVEVDPLKPDSMPKKRTALGRFKHENAEVVLAADGHVVVYMGDDERGEFLYRFVSEGRYAEGVENDDLLEHGTLYAARFADGGRGEWIALTPQSTGMASQAEICIHTRQAASAVKATTMDRPEWVAANPNKVEVYCSLTHNKHRGRKPNAGGDPMPVGGPNPRKANRYGQIVRWAPDDGDHLSDSFTWDLFVMAGNPTVHSDARAGSKNVNKSNMFNSPDGLSFDSNGLLWIRTDGNYSNKKHFKGQGNNQLLVADPVTGEIARFLVGPRQCELSGLAWSADGRTLFIGVQHPGEKGDSHFPDGGDTVPRSAVVAISRDDGSPIG